MSLCKQSNSLSQRSNSLSQRSNSLSESLQKDIIINRHNFISGDSYYSFNDNANDSLNRINLWVTDFCSNKSSSEFYTRYFIKHKELFSTIFEHLRNVDFKCNNSFLGFTNNISISLLNSEIKEICFELKSLIFEKMNNYILKFKINIKDTCFELSILDSPVIKSIRYSDIQNTEAFYSLCKSFYSENIYYLTVGTGQMIGYEKKKDDTQKLIDKYFDSSPLFNTISYLLNMSEMEIKEDYLKDNEIEDGLVIEI